MPVQIRAPNGDILNFPDGTSDAQIAEIMRREYPGPAQQQQQAVAQWQRQSEQTFRRAGATQSAGVGLQSLPAPRGGDGRASLGDTSRVRPLPGSTTMRVPGGTVTVGPPPQRPIGQRPESGVARTAFDAVDSAASFGRNALQSAATMATNNPAMNPLGPVADNWQFINRNLPVLAQPFTGRSNEQVRGDIEDWEARRTGTGVLSTAGERVAELINARLPYTPSSETAAFAGRAGAAAPGAATPGGIIPTLLGFGASEAAGLGAQALNASPEQVDTARTFGGIGGGVLAAPFSGARPSERLIRDASRPMQAADVALARSLMERARNLPGGGVRLTGPEALAEVAPTRAGLVQALAQDLAATRKGAARTIEATANRPQEVTNATLGVADQIAPAIVDPTIVGLRAQTGAQGAMKGAEDFRTAETRPLYERANNQYPDADAVMQIAGALRARARQDQTGLTSQPALDFADQMMGRQPPPAPASTPIPPRVELAPEAPGPVRYEAVPPGEQAALPPPPTQWEVGAAAPEAAPAFTPGPASYPMLNIENTARLGRYHRDTSEIPLGEPGALSRETAGLVGGAANELLGVLNRNPDFAAANNRYGQISDNLVDPLAAGPLGPIARTNSPGRQSQALYPTAPSEGQPGVTVRAIRALEDQSPGTAADLTRLRLVDALAERGQAGRAGPNMAAGADVAAYLEGNPTQAATYRAGLQEVAPAAMPDYSALIDVLRATGKRTGEAPAAYADQVGQEALSRGGPILEGVRRAAQPFTSTGASISNWLRGRQLNSNADALLQVLLADPGTFESGMLSAMNSGPGQRLPIGVSKALIAALAAADADNDRQADDRR